MCYICYLVTTTKNLLHSEPILSHVASLKSQAKARKKGKGRALKPGEGLADIYWNIFKHACHHKKQAVRAVALDCLEKLIGMFVSLFLLCGCFLSKAVDRSLLCLFPPSTFGPMTAHGHLIGGCSVKKASPKAKDNKESPKLLIDDIVETICGCKEHADDQVQIQV